MSDAPSFYFTGAAGTRMLASRVVIIENPVGQDQNNAALEDELDAAAARHITHRWARFKFCIGIMLNARSCG